MTEDTDSEDDEDIDVFPREFGERFLLGLLDFRTKLQINQLDENIGKQSKSSNVSLTLNDSCKTVEKIFYSMGENILIFMYKLKNYCSYDKLYIMREQFLSVIIFL